MKQSKISCPPTNEEIDKAAILMKSVFSSLFDNQNNKSGKRIKKIKYRTFIDIMNKYQLTLDYFYIVMK